jgi:hypothetical protein
LDCQTKFLQANSRDTVQKMVDTDMANMVINKDMNK